MKLKHIIFIAFICLILTACHQEDIVCSDDELIVNGVCIALSDEQMILRESIANMDLQTKFALDIQITRGSNSYDIQILFDGDKRAFTIDNNTDYYVLSEDLCTYFLKTAKGYIESSCETSSADEYSFFYSFEFAWFEYINGFYYLGIQHHQVLTSFFQNTIENCQVTNFMMTIEDDLYDQFMFDVTVDHSIWNFVMNFSNFGNVDIILPESGE